MAIALKEHTGTRRKVHIEVTMVTPDIANAWLDKNSKNRKLTEHTVKKYVSDMKRGAWRLSGDAIRFSRDGTLLDGQHRLVACIRAGVPFETLVVYGLDDDARDVMDTGKSRTIADVLEFHGITNSRRVSSAVRQLIVYRDGYATSRSASISHSEVMTALYAHPNITKSVAVSGNVIQRLPLAGIGFLHYSASFFAGQKEAADAMIDVLRTGVPSYDGDAMHAFRERLLRRHAEGDRGNHDANTFTLFYAWNAYVDKKPLNVVRWQSSPVDIDGVDRKKL